MQVMLALPRITAAGSVIVVPASVARLLVEFKLPSAGAFESKQTTVSNDVRQPAGMLDSLIVAATPAVPVSVSAERTNALPVTTMLSAEADKPVMVKPKVDAPALAVAVLVKRLMVGSPAIGVLSVVLSQKSAAVVQLASPPPAMLTVLVPLVAVAATFIGILMLK